MVTAGEYRISRIVAVWRSPAGDLHVVAPCGRCREFMRQVDEENMHADVVLGPHRFAFLRDLLPESVWPADPVPGETRPWA
jgi:cytidine deaminase